MKRGKILKVRPGHEANCSSEAYLGGILVGLLGYGLLLPILLAVESAVRWRRGLLAKVALWVVPHLLALGVFLYWAYTSGAMDYGSFIFVGVLALGMLIGMGVGWARIVARHNASQGPSATCPRCGRPLGPRELTTAPDAELFHLVMHPRAMPAEIAALDLEQLTTTVAYRRRRKVTKGALDPDLSDEQIAQRILDFARSFPAETTVPAEQVEVCPWCGLDLAAVRGPAGLGVSAS